MSFAARAYRTFGGRLYLWAGLPGAWTALDDLQFSDLPGLLRDRARAAQHAVQLAPEEDQPDDRVVFVLRRVESAVRHPAVDLDRGRLVGGAMDGPRQARTHAPHVDADLGRREPRDARLFQIWRFPDGQFRVHRRLARHHLSPAGVGHRPPGRHQLLYLRHPLLHARRLFAALGAGWQLPQLRSVRDLLPAPRRRPDHAPDRARPAVRGAAPRQRQPDLLRLRIADPRPVPKGGARRWLPRAGGRGGLRRAWSGPGNARQLGRDARLRRPDLLRFRRLLDLGDRSRFVPRLRHARQFPLPLWRRRLLRLLAALAHHSVELAARLSLHSRWAATATARRALMPR